MNWIKEHHVGIFIIMVVLMGYVVIHDSITLVTQYGYDFTEILKAALIIFFFVVVVLVWFPFILIKRLPQYTSHITIVSVLLMVMLFLQ